MGDLYVASFELATTSGTVTASHGTAYVNGFPSSIQGLRIEGIRWPNGASTQGPSVRFSIFNNSLRGWYNSSNETITSASPLTINIAAFAPV